MNKTTLHKTITAALPRPRDRRALGLIALMLLAGMAVFFQSRRAPAVLAGAAVGPRALEEVTVEATRRPVYVPTEEDVLWLARGIYSETKQPHEQELVAWVIRNRVETEYRGRGNYHDVVLDPQQFSAFNSDSPVRGFYMSLRPQDSSAGWKAAVGIARRVAWADTTVRPFDGKTRHFYSEQSMVGARRPAWAVNKMPVKLPQVEEKRFRFYADVN